MQVPEKEWEYDDLDVVDNDPPTTMSRISHFCGSIFNPFSASTQKEQTISI